MRNLDEKLTTHWCNQLACKAKALPPQPLHMWGSCKHVKAFKLCLSFFCFWMKASVNTVLHTLVTAGSGLRFSLNLRYVEGGWDDETLMAVCNFCLQRSLQRHRFELQETEGANVSAPTSPVKVFWQLAYISKPKNAQKIQRRNEAKTKKNKQLF